MHRPDHRTSIHTPSALRRTSAALLALLVGALALGAGTTARAWGPGGHQSVGAIADGLLAGTPTGARVRQLLGGSLAAASVWADCARSVRLDKGVARYQVVDSQGHTHPECAEFEKGNNTRPLIDFVTRNATRCGVPFSGSASCTHEAYHFANLSIARDAYDAAAPGASTVDLVHAVQAAVTVLQGGQASSPINIRDKREALRLLAHWVGDLHQPLHVGVVYLDAAGQRVEPASPADLKVHGNGGGNGLLFEGGNLHHVWDSLTGAQLAKLKGPAALAAARAVPASPGQVNAWPEAWAGDTLQRARQAFDGLRFGPQQAKAWPATADEPAYRRAREALQREQVIKAGAHLAELLKATVP